MRSWATSRIGGSFCLLVFLLSLGTTACSGIPGFSKPAYPEKAVTVIVPLGPGSQTDVLWRAMVDAAKPYFPQPLAIVNRTGAGGGVGIAEAVQAKPDGYTVGGPFNATLTVLPNIGDVPYKGPDDYRPVINLVKTPFVFVVRADAPWKTMKEALDYAKANPKKIRVGTAGTGTGAHLNLEDLKAAAGVDMAHVPFAGAQESIPALIGGNVEANVVPVSPALAQVRGGKARVLLVFDSQRSTHLPDAPSAKEMGYDIIRVTYNSAIVPKGTPDEVVKILHDSIKKTIESDAFKKFSSETQMDNDYMSGEDLKKRIIAELAVDAQTLKKMGMIK